MAEGLATYLTEKGMAEGAERVAEALCKAKPEADAASLQVCVGVLRCMRQSRPSTAL
jgi:hypothetical protein